MTPPGPGRGTTGGAPRRFARCIEARRAVGSATRYIVGSAHTAGDIHELFGIQPDRIDVAYHGVRVDPGAPATSEAELRGRLSLGSDPVVLCVAQKRPYKNQEALVHALADERLAGVRLVLPGAPTTYEQRLAQLATKLRVAGR